jgi:hypothetical protein
LDSLLEKYFSFFEPFSARLASKLAKNAKATPQKLPHKILIMMSKKAELYVDFESMKEV